MSTPSFLWLSAVLLFFSLLSPASTFTHRPEEVVGQHGVVATDDRRCSEIGVGVLKEGGHAVDAAIAAAFCLGVVSPASSGIGGGAFMLIREATGKTQAFDMRETAPKAASQDMYHGNETLKKIGILAVAVPGEVAGFRKAWEQHGQLPWARLVKPAEVLARQGFKISPYLYFQMQQTESAVLSDQGLRSVFAPNGTLLQVNETAYNRKLAKTLELIGKYGVRTFYNGLVGLSLIHDIKKAGGIITMDDLRNYTVKTRTPLVEDVLGLEIIGFPPPSSGGATMMLMLNILAKYPIPSGLDGTLGVHRKIEALKNAFAVRSNLGDPDFVNITAVLADMLSPTFAKTLQLDINDTRTYGPRHYGGKWNPLNDHGTSHISIIDQQRNAVAMTCTVNSFFGSQILSPSTGMVLNNEMDDFSMPSLQDGLPAPPNFIRPGKRPLSSMSPTIVLKDGKLKAVLGASGGANIIAGTTEVFLNHFVHRMEPLKAVMAPRFYHTWVPNIAYYENWTSVINDHYQMPNYILASLKKKGHHLEEFTSAVVCQFAEVNQIGDVEELVGVSDPRKGGIPAAF
ncbi:Gamma-glutamyltranspeptidase [Melia azedarach]|uniref:Gamma-glutamyltranspeptidase n=1 Tax=Melia azedarach TaxID=155640 RepID=A0ACC1XXI0_MELAZ|nr:Gamma-glutamyltranspeptidase [Melia azedarach]